SIEVDERTEAARLAADDRDHQRKPERPGANERLRGTADAEPDRQRILEWSRVHALPGQRGAVPSRPVHVLVPTDLGQQIEPLSEERVIVIEVEAEQGKGLDE